MKQNKSLLSQTFSIYRGPLFRGLLRVENRIIHYKAKVKEFYFRVLLSQYECPKCGAELKMTGPSQCSCLSRHTFDPTLAFQHSPCCGVSLERKTLHFRCSKCRQTVPSRFLFDEKLFDRTYFREMMQEARVRERRKKEQLKAILAGSRSGTLLLLEEPSLEIIPDLTNALNGFVGTQISLYDFSPTSKFRMDDYRSHILSVLGVGSRLFSDIPPLIEDRKRDRIWRFVTLIFMCQAGEVSLTQYGSDLLVERVCNEAHY